MAEFKLKLDSKCAYKHNYGGVHVKVTTNDPKTKNYNNNKRKNLVLDAL